MLIVGLLYSNWKKYVFAILVVLSGMFVHSSASAQDGNEILRLEGFTEAVQASAAEAANWTGSIIHDSREWELDGLEDATDAAVEAVKENQLAEFAQVARKGSRVLLLGDAQGAAATSLREMGFEIDVVVTGNKPVAVASAASVMTPDDFRVHVEEDRHFVHRTLNKYDLVVIDMEIYPVHMPYLLTREGRSDLKRITANGSRIIVRFDGFDGKSPSKGFRQLYRSLCMVKPYVKFWEDPANSGSEVFLLAGNGPDGSSVTPY